MSSEFITKRLFLSSEINQVKELLSSSELDFTEFYPKYLVWLEKAIIEIQRGDKIAIGLFSSKIIDISRIEFNLIGTAILKKNQFNKSIELKSLYLVQEMRKKGGGSYLCNQVIEYCKKHGFEKVETQIPANLVSLVHFFLKNGFQISHQLTSGYQQNQFIYNMFIPVKSYYRNDPFDINSFSRWILEDLYSFDILDNTVQGEIPFSITPNDLSNQLSQNEMEITGIAFIEENLINKENCDIIIEKKKKMEAMKQVFFVFGEDFQHEIKNSFIENGIFPISRKFYFGILGSQIMFRNFNFTKEDVGGMIILIKRDYFESIEKNQEYITYVKGGSVGKYLKEGDLILFFVEPSEKNQDFGIMGCGILKHSEIVHNKADNLWERVKNQNPIFTEEDLTKFAKNKEILQIMQINHFQQIKIIKTPELADLLSDNTIDLEDWGNFYFNKTKKEIFLKRFSQDENLHSVGLVTSEMIKDELKDINFKFRDQIIDINSISKFISQIPEERFQYAMLKILSRIKNSYYKSEDLLDLIKREIVKILPNSRTPIYCIIFPNSAKESNGLWTKLLKYYLSEYKSSILNSEDFIIKIKNEKKKIKDSIIIFIDDFIGTGNQFISNYSEFIMKEISIENLNSLKIYLVSGFCSPATAKRISQETNIKFDRIKFCIPLTKTHQAFNEEDWEDPILLSEFKNYLREIDPEYWDGWKKDKLDGKGLKYIIVTEWKVPNNTIGCLWNKKTDNKKIKWNPLFSW